jgi:hypothetical protein
MATGDQRYGYKWPMMRASKTGIPACLSGAVCLDLVMCICRLPAFYAANVAQLAEQRIRNAQVGGSTPLVGSISGIMSGYLYILVSQKNDRFYLGSTDAPKRRWLEELATCFSLVSFPASFRSRIWPSSFRRDGGGDECRGCRWNCGIRKVKISCPKEADN